MADVLNFEASEFIVLEDGIEVDESIERPERVRFYTLEEQEVDAFEKLTPKGRVTQYQRDVLQNELGRMHDLYVEHIVSTADDYALREPQGGTNLSWVYPVYATGERTSYDYSRNWIPLFENQRIPNVYPRMMTALGHPFAETQEGTPYELSGPTEFLSSEGQSPIRALPTYLATKAVRHEDKTITIEPSPIAGTEDRVPFVGYYLAKRPLDLPNPLLDHPFLQENKPTFVASTSPLHEVIPSLDAVMTHAVPTTSDPYGVAEPYLKLYDIRLQSIPWSSWKSRFPPADAMAMLAERVEIPFPKSESQAPGPSVIEAYKTTYAPGIAAREWLLRQEDGGEFVVRALQSVVIDNGSVEMIPGISLPLPTYPATTLQECALTGLTFPDFTTKGLLRRSWTVDKGKDIITLQCVPLEFVAQERARVGYLNRKQWLETTGREIKERQLKAIRRVRRIEEEDTSTSSAAKQPARPESQMHAEVLAILNDPHRHVQDKRRDLRDLMANAILSNEVYTDADGVFVLCSHTLAILSGEYEADRRAFLDKWTASVDGFRVCKHCGQQIDALELVDQDEYTEDGFRVKHTDTLDAPPTVVSETMQLYMTGLSAIRPLFQMEDAMDATCFTVLSLLQVLPTGDLTDVVLKIGREIASKLGKEADRFKGTLGLALAVILIQGHTPPLVPRRSFGSKPLKLNGYPRDSPDPEPFSIVDTLLMVMEMTFRAYPTSLTGPTQQVIRGILSNSGDIKKNMLVFLKAKLLPHPSVKAMLEKAKAFQAGLPPTESPPPLIPATVPPKTLGVIRQYEECPSLRPVLEGANPPRIRQPDVPLRTGLLAASSRVAVTPVKSTRVQVVSVPKAELQRRIVLEKQAKVSVRDPYRTNLAIASRLADIAGKPLPVRSVNPAQSPAELRDLARGLVYESVVNLQVPLAELIKKEVALFCLTADPKEQKAQARTIRATERLSYVKRMAALTDQEREVNMELAKRGMAPILIELEERVGFARDVEENAETNPEIGVGLYQDYYEQGESNAAAGVDNGNYGDYTAVPFNDGRDYREPTLGDDEDRGI